MNEKILVTQATLPEFNEYAEEIKTIWENNWLTNMGVKHQELQRSLCKYLGVSNIELLVNGHMSLELSLQALELQGEVITSPFTFASTTHAIVRNGLTPVFCDINEDNYTIDVNKIESLITDKTCAILPIHVYGNVCDVEKIDTIAKQHGLVVIYDAAHAFGETYKGNGIGQYGNISCFSFHATKVFNTIEGGAASFADEEIGKKIYNLKNFGIRGPEDVVGVGMNAKMNEFQAAMGICNLRHIKDNIEKRHKVVLEYQKRLSHISGIKCWREQKEVVSNYAYFPIIIDETEYKINRNQLQNLLTEYNYFPRKYFYPITSEFECYKGKFVGDVPIAKRISERVLTLPLYPNLESEHINRICDIIENPNSFR